MSSIATERALVIEESAAFVPSTINGDSPRRKRGRTVETQYEVRSTTSSEHSLLSGDPFSPEVTHPWRLLVNGSSLFVLTLTGGLIVVALLPMLWGWQAAPAGNQSMAPSVQSSDLVVTSPSDGLNLGPGTIVRYTEEEASVLGRIGAVTSEGYLVVEDAPVTAGELLDPDDATLVLPRDVEGVGELVVPWIGLPFSWVQGHAWVKVAVLAAGTSLLFWVSRKRWITPKTKWHRA